MQFAMIKLSFACTEKKWKGGEIAIRFRKSSM